MTVMPVFAPYLPTYASHKSYITTQEYLTAPTGCDVTQLYPGGTVAENTDVLAGVIQRASSDADTYLYGPSGCLAATIDTQVSPPDGWRIQRDKAGRLVVKIPIDYTPIIAVTGVSLGRDPAQVTALTDLTGVWPTRKVITVPVSALTSTPPGTVPGTGPSTASAGGRMWGTATYLNGFFHASLTANTSVGATSITTTDSLGAYPGLPVVVYDDALAHTETAVIASTYVPGTATVTLAAPLAYAHTAGTQVSAVPPTLRQAVIHLTSALIKGRGGEAIVLDSLSGTPNRVQIGEAGMTEDHVLAYRILDRFRRAC